MEGRNREVNKSAWDTHVWTWRSHETVEAINNFLGIAPKLVRWKKIRRKNSKDVSPRIDFSDGNAETCRNVFHRFVSIRYYSNSLGDGLGSDRMIPGHHDDLDPGTPALADRVRDGWSRRIDHRHEPDEAESVQGKVFRLGVEWKPVWVIVGWKQVIAEAENSFSHPTQLHVGLVEGFLPGVVDWNVLSVQWKWLNNDRGFSLERPSWRAAFHLLPGSGLRPACYKFTTRNKFWDIEFQCIAVNIIVCTMRVYMLEQMRTLLY